MNSLLSSSRAGLPYLGILCAWTTTQMLRGSCWPPLRQTGEDNWSSPHHMAQHHSTGSETSPSYAPRSSRFGSETPSVEDDVDVWRYATVSCMPEMTTNTDSIRTKQDHHQKLTSSSYWSAQAQHQVSMKLADYFCSNPAHRQTDRTNNRQTNWMA